MDILALVKLIGKPLDALFKWRAQHHQQYEVQQEDYLDDTMGNVCCLDPNAHEPEAVSLDTLARRAQIRKKQHPQHTFPTDKAEIESIANRMVRKGKLNRGRYPETYKRP